MHHSCHNVQKNIKWTFWQCFVYHDSTFWLSLELSATAMHEEVSGLQTFKRCLMHRSVSISAHWHKSHRRRKLPSIHECDTSLKLNTGMKCGESVIFSCDRIELGYFHTLHIVWSDVRHFYVYVILTFQAVFNNPSVLLCSLLGLQLSLVIIQIVILVRSSEWYHVVSLALLLFANYYTLFKLSRDYLICWKVYKAEQMIQDKIGG